LTSSTWRELPCCYAFPNRCTENLHKHVTALSTTSFYVLAAIFEIAGCFAFWAWLRLDRTALWLAAGVPCLILFALCLTQVEAAFAGRAFAAYGGVYIVVSLVWLLVVEGTRPDRWDTIGAVVCLLGSAIILWGPRE
jgi:small multidrug resistance family-3 protein